MHVSWDMRHVLEGISMCILGARTMSYICARQLESGM